ncbi:M28 family metallopeptidase [Lysobacter koreensis]|uniref:M28 family metallopeptidase n=1 Tax=Lysobacter koreensis TaxID=266122 RepID=A0ABW2YJ48_9GAMM
MPQSRLPAARSLVTASLLLCLAACMSTQRSPDPVAAGTVVPARGNATGNWLADIGEMSASVDNAARRAVVQRRLDALGIAWRAAPFEADDQRGTNLLAELDAAADAPVLLIGAHFDRVDTGRGATDNASGSATVLALAERFKRTPLRHHRLAIAFWDLEERGLLGAKAYIAGQTVPPALYVNFDVFGWGDTLWMMAPDPAHALLASTREAAAEAQLGLSAGPQYPPTDHLPFLAAKWPAVSYSLVGGDEIPLILQLYAGKKPKAVPKVMRVIHSDHDTPAQLDAVAALRGVDAVEDALRRWDAGAATMPPISN